MRVGKGQLQVWVVEALEDLGGSAPLIDVSRTIWERHEQDLRDSDELFFTWQYDMRWAANQLRTSGKLKQVKASRSGLWELAK
jgi:hypothetical protein